MCAAGWEFFERFDDTVRAQHFHPFIPAEYEIVRDALLEHRAPGQTFLEWGSGSGVITIMADLVGFDAYGIELDSALVQSARTLAKRFDSRATFVCGSFLPTGYRWPGMPGTGDEPFTGDGPSGYLQLGRALADFDVVYGYPWNGEAPMMRDLMAKFGRRDALLLLNDTIEGVHAERRASR